MAGTLTTSIFLNFQNKFKKRCKTLFLEAYQTSISNNSISLNFNENDITAILHNYIDTNPKRKEWEISSNLENYIFENDTIPIKGFAAKFSRIDMRYSTFWKGEEYKYFVEAKNLKANDSGSKRRYITTGIDNFLTGGKYSDCDGFLVGYILNGNIQDCIIGINKLLEKDNRKTEALVSNTFLDFDLFSSNHTVKNLNHLFLLYSN
ncbi:hypothetical protein [Flavobacterium sp.]|jgi:hypothetical protein|uniref:hypothetical protein n=1 Tax=Flavobacterium sp. TaxID=239 RepID=UPI0037C0E254